MKRILTIICTLISFSVFSQVQNKIPEYIFNYRLGVGRFTAGDTTAYLIVGPDGGATKGIKLPMVTDTAAVVGAKKNGLTIFSVQYNQPVYWDSVNSRWKPMGGSLQHAPGTGDSLLFTDGTKIRLVADEYGIITTQYTNEMGFKVDTMAIPTRYTIDSLGQIIVGNFPSASLYNGLPSSDDTLIFWRNDSTVFIKTPVAGWGLLSDASVRTDTTWGWKSDSNFVTSHLKLYKVLDSISTAIGLSTIYNADDTLLGNRVVELDGNYLEFNEGGVPMFGFYPWNYSNSSFFFYTDIDSTFLSKVEHTGMASGTGAEEYMNVAFDQGKASYTLFANATTTTATTYLSGQGIGVYFMNDQIQNPDSTALIFPISATTNTGLFSLAHDTTTGQIVRIPAGGGGGSYTFEYGLYESSDVVYIDTTLITSRLWLYKVADSLAATWTAGDTANLIFDTIPVGGSPTALFQSGDTLRTRSFGDSTLISWTVNGAGKLVAVLDTGNAFFDGGGGGGGCATCWDYATLNSPGATGLFGTADNNAIDIYSNNIKRGSVLANGHLLWGGTTDISNYIANFQDTVNIANLRIGGVVTPFSALGGLNANLVIKGANASSSSFAIATYNSTPANTFRIDNAGNAYFPFIWNSFTSTLLRSAAATQVYGVSNGAGTSGSLMSFTPLSTSSNIGATTTNVVEINGNYQEIAPYSNTGIYSSLSLKTTYNGAAGKGPGYVAGLTTRAQLTSIPEYRAINILDSGMVYTTGAIHYNQKKAPATTGDYTVAKEDHFIYLPDLTTEAANRNVSMSAPLTEGRELVIFNTNSDATYKWSFSGAVSVIDAAGNTITTITDGTSYVLRYYYGAWRVISIS